MAHQRTAGSVPEGMLPVQEIFGPVPQGEGPHMGRRACFIRFGRCNLHCPPCDSKQTWDTTRYDLAQTCPPRTAQGVIEDAVRCGSGSAMTVLTGGEPLLWQQTSAWGQVLAALPGEVHVETNATIVPNAVTTQRVAYFSASPKLGTMGAADPPKRRLVPAALEAFADLARDGRAAFKFVAANTSEVDEAAGIVRDFHVPSDRVWIMPLGDATSWAPVGRDIVGHVMKVGFNLSGRLHLTLGVR